MNETENLQNQSAQEEIKPLIFNKRDYQGLLINGKIVTDEYGFIDYKKLLPKKYLAINKEKTQETDIEKVAEEHQIILLAGLRYLANLRGFTSVDYETLSCSKDFVAVKCTIEWIANVENPAPVKFSAIGDACRENTSESVASLFLSPIAENRAFARAVRQFLRISNVAENELKNNTGESVPASASVEIVETACDPSQVLKELMNQVGLTLEKVKSVLTQEGNNEAALWLDVKDIPKPIIFELITRIKKKMEKNPVPA